MIEKEHTFFGIRLAPRPSPEEWRVDHQQFVEQTVLTTRKYLATSTGPAELSEAQRAERNHLNNGFRPSLRFHDSVIMYLGEPTLPPRMDFN